MASDTDGRRLIAGWQGRYYEDFEVATSTNTPTATP
jgi:hypothetical protein